ncbi:MAG: sugar ABC transporter substrate-binding protein [Candidatus Hodarchaeales archaeon]
MKKELKLLIIATFLLAIGPTAFPTLGAPTQDTTITFWWTEGTTEGALYTDLIAEFETDNPSIKVTSVQKGYFDQPTEWNNAFLAGDEPDVLRADVTWITTWANDGSLEEINPNDVTDWDDFSDESVEKVQWKDKAYGIPQVVDALGMFYNKHAFSEAGITVPANGFTWTQFKDAGDKLNTWAASAEFDHGNVTSDQFYAFNMQGYSYAFLPIMYGHGATYFANNNLTLDNMNFNTSEWVAALQFLTDILPGGANEMTPPVAEQGWGNIDSYFHQGRVGMIFMGPWATSGYYANGAMFNSTAYEVLYGGTAPSWVNNDNLGFMKVPTGGAGKQGIHSGGHAYVVSSQSEEKDAAFKLADWLAGKKAAYLRAKTNHLVSPRASTFSDDFDTTDSYDPAADPIVEGFKLNLNTGITRPIHPYWIPVDNLVAPELETFRANIGDFSNITGTLEAIESRVSAYLTVNPVIIGGAGERPLTVASPGFELFFVFASLVAIVAIRQKRK